MKTQRYKIRKVRIGDYGRRYRYAVLDFRAPVGERQVWSSDEGATLVNYAAAEAKIAELGQEIISSPMDIGAGAYRPGEGLIDRSPLLGDAPVRFVRYAGPGYAVVYVFRLEREAMLPLERLHTTPTHEWGPPAPADEGDVRFLITELEEPEMGATHLVRVIDDRGDEAERFTTDDPYGAVEACREAQNTTLEERFDMYAERGW